MFRIDLEAIGINYVTEAGIAGFHGLRHTFVSNLATGGVHLKVAQQLARHSTITLTMDRYSHLELIDMTAGLSARPNVIVSESHTMRVIGAIDQTPENADSICIKSCTRPVQLNRFQPL